MTSKDLIIQLESQLKKAMIAGDISTLDNLLHDDLLFVIPNGQTVTKAMDLQNFKQGLINLVEISIQELDVNIIGDNAIVSIQINMVGCFNDQPFQGDFKYIRIWKKIDDTWKVIGGAGLSHQ